MELKTILLTVCFLSVSEGAKILGVWTVTSKSHYILGSRFMKTLADAGHDVTFISPYEGHVVTNNGSFRNIAFKIDSDGKTDVTPDFLEDSRVNIFSLPLLTYSIIMEDLLNDKNVKQLLNSGEKFDVVIVEQFGNDAIKALAHHFDSHLIAFSSTFANEWVNDLVGNPAPTSYVPVICSTFPRKMSLVQKTHNTMLYIFRRLLTYLYVQKEQERIRRKYFPNAPSVNEINSNTSLLFVNGHESLNQPVPMVPNMVQVGGYHVDPPGSLPDDLQRFMDESSEGVIYFSLGTILKSSNLPDSRRQMFIDTFSKLKQRILWKWDNDTMIGKPSNVEIRKWMPQSEIIAHPNLKLFITHGGLLGGTEAVYHGVPVLVIPVFADQLTNAQNAEEGGYALSLPYSSPEFSQPKLESMIRDLLDNDRYKRNAMERSLLFHNRPMTPKETINYWVDYVIRTKGAHHLKVEGVTMPWYQYYLVDVAVLVILMSVSPILALVLICKFIKKVRNGKEKLL